MRAAPYWKFLCALAITCLCLPVGRADAQTPNGVPLSTTPPIVQPPMIGDPPALPNTARRPLPDAPILTVDSAASIPQPSANPTEVRRIVADYLSELETKRSSQDPVKPAEDPNKPYEIGSDLNLRAHWQEGRGLVFTSANKDWDIHVGGRFQFEPVFFQQGNNFRGPGPGAGGIPNSAKNGGQDTQDDGAYFRRVRFRTDGTGYETIEFALEVNFEQLNYITYDHLWVGMKDLPFIDTARVGQHKVPLGMENIGSDYHLSMLERSSAADAFSVLFAPGLFLQNNFFNQNVVVQAMLHKTQPLGFYTSEFGNGNIAGTGRVTWTPVYEDEGREIIHVGVGYQYRTANLGRELQPGGTGNAFGDSQNVMRFRARPDLRDGIGIGSGGNLGGSVDRMVDTGFILADGAHTLVPEFLTIWGPFSIQAEHYMVQVENARNLLGPGKVGNSFGNPFFFGGYVESSYFLTGERRGYDRRSGMYDRPVLDQNGFAVRGDNGRINWNLGAVQLAYRYSYLDLDSNGLNGGIMTQHSFGLNWYINNTTKVQFQYSISERDVASPAVNGTLHGFGMLAQWYF